MLSTGRYDINGVLIEEMDVVQWGNEVGLVTFNEHLNEFIFANDFMVESLSNLTDLVVLMKHTKIDELAFNDVLSFEF